MPTITRGLSLPIYKITLEAMPFSTAAPVLEMEAGFQGELVKLRIGEQEITVEAKVLLKAVNTLTKD